MQQIEDESRMRVQSCCAMGWNRLLQIDNDIGMLFSGFMVVELFPPSI